MSRWRALALLVAALVLACQRGGAPDLQPAVDLIERLPFATARSDVARIRTAGVRATAPGPPRAEAGRLFLPAGSRLEFSLELPAGSELRIGAAAWRGPGGGRLEAFLQADGEQERSLGAWPRSKVPARVPLGLEHAIVARLTLRAALGEAVEPGWEGIELTGPEIWAPAGGATAASAAQAPAPVPTESAGAAGARLNVVVYLVDTLRADHLGCYGYPLPTSPRLDAFAQEATVFETAIAQSGWTRASTASILTGLWPYAHGANLRRDRLADEALTLGELLQAAGYRTAAFVGNPNVTRNFGFGQGFDDFVVQLHPHRSDAITERVLDWLDRAAAEPFFLYVHTVDPHDPYDPPDAFRRRLAGEVPAELVRTSSEVLRDLTNGARQPDPRTTAALLSLYDAEIAHNDHQFGRLLDRLRAGGLLERTVIVFVSDHGEEFHEHGGWTHGRTLEAETVNVPLVVRVPRLGEGQRVPEPAQHIDLLPTLLEALGIEPPTGLEGRSLLPLMGRTGTREIPGWAPRPIYTYLRLDRRGRPGTGINERLGILDGEWKLTRILEGPGHGARRLYRWPEDRGELHDLARARPVRADYLQALAAERLAGERRQLAADEAVLDPETAAALRALGYVP